MNRIAFRRLRRALMGRLFASLMVISSLAVASLPARADDEEPSPFKVATRAHVSNGVHVVTVAFGIPPAHILYADKLSFHWTASEENESPAIFSLPESVVVTDKFSGKEKKVFQSSFEASGTFPIQGTKPSILTVHFQGCDEANCFFPEDLRFSVSPAGEVIALLEEAEQSVNASATSAEWRKLAEGFTVSARGSGYLKEAEFIEFLDRSKSGQAASEGLTSETGAWGVMLTMLLIVLGGAALNLTPCVLPMIPINIAIIGAGAQAGSKKRGFALGATYATGMAVAYGVLGLVVVLTGSKFGTLNSSPWFNLAIAAVFVVLGLGMFDILAIDLSRFQGAGPSGDGGSKSKFVVAYSMGTVAALLAGACVAPVVISVLLQATTLYNKGVIAGLFLPFILGLGMGLPWPFAGAGLSFLPKPGRWMARVKYGFGAFIMLFALYYGHLAFGLFRANDEVLTASAKGTESVAVAQAALSEQLSIGLSEARATGKPVFIDFWASWCKNCSAMEHTTFQSPAVKEHLAGFLQLRLQTERLNHPPTKEVLDYFKVLGLPSFVVLTPMAGEPSVIGSAPNTAALSP